MSDSFSSELSNQRAADLAILNCLKNQTGTTSEFGITLANGHSTAYQALAIASTKYSTLSSKISSLSSSSCGSNCGTGSNIASGMYSAIQQYSGSGFANTKKNIVIITDGVPNTDNTVDANLLTMAKNQAAVAAAAGISISTIYYSGDTDPSDQASYAASLATLVTGTGVAMVAPSAAQITSNIGGFCATLPSALKLVL
jgi:hypothetical protein